MIGSLSGVNHDFLTVPSRLSNGEQGIVALETRDCMRGISVLIGTWIMGWATAGFAGTVSYTGTLASSADSFLTTLNLASAGTVTLQTYGFGGGVNAAGTTIAAGGFDPFIGLFSGTGDGAVFINGTSDVLTNYTMGCPPAGTAILGGSSTCGDVDLQFTGLTPGTYTVLLSDGAYIPAAVFESPGGLLGDGFVDLTGGVFQTCDTNGHCNTDTANWALDVTAPDSTKPPSPVPEPASVELVALAVTLAAARVYRRNKKAI